MKINKIIIFGTILIIFIWTIPSISSLSINAKSLNKNKPLKGVNGGTTCVVCTVLVTMTEELSIVYNQTVEQSLINLCNYLPKGIFRTACTQILRDYGQVIINGLYLKEDADVICHALKFCTTDKGQPECKIRPNPQSIELRLKEFKIKLQEKNIELPAINDNQNFCDIAIFKKICDYFDNIFNNHTPGVDLDKDGHSTYSTLRGSSWKGKDCNDLDKNIRPGVKPKNGDRLQDSNCNGIYGIDSNSGLSYEELFCKNSSQMGFAVLGDSISAHFHIPEEWLDATKINAAVFEHLAFILENELDWPELSAGTGFMDSVWPVVSGPTRSIYLNMFNRNKCLMRDYQNVAVNGASSGSMKNIAKSLVRNQEQDYPMLILYALVGNDVCNGHPDTINHMTKPDEFYKNVVNTMNYLDTVLPKGSHIIMTGLANGSLLFDSLGDRVYPLGRVKNDIKYSDIYTYLSCLQISPCNGWMTTNATLRKYTTDYAEMLSGLVKNVSLTHKYNNFDMHYFDFPFDSAIAKWKAMGGETWQLIEPVDGFHTNQIANALIADTWWEILNGTNWIPPINPFNDQITKLFGNQGGY